MALSSLARRALALVALVGVVASCQPSPDLGTDADNARPPADPWGWFEADLEWRGDFPDPHVVVLGDTYYAYSSPTGGRYLPVLTSTDLETWRIHARWTTARTPWSGGPDPSLDAGLPEEIRRSTMSPGDKWNMKDGLVRAASWGLPHDQGSWLKRDLWAPGVAKIGATWFAYSAVKVSDKSDDPNGFGRFCITVASATSPAGPFRDVGSGPVVCDVDPAGSIDPSPFHDPATGVDHLLWKSAGRVGRPGVPGYPSALKAQPLRADGTLDPTMKPVTLLSTNERSWEGFTIENPSMVEWRGTHYLFYSGNDFLARPDGSSSYATGYAVCPDGPRGP